MKAISIKQPWASLIAHGIKDIENRTWATKYRGKVLIHASGKPAGDAYELFTDYQWEFIEANNFDSDVFESYHYLSRIIGEVEIIDCVLNHPSIWAEKSIIFQEEGKNNEVYEIWNWVLANPILYEKPILNVKGKLSFWEFENNLKNKNKSKINNIQPPIANTLL